MNTDWTPATLQAFERDIAATFNRGEIKAPVHLADGNELELIKIFKDIRPQDWVCGSWRSHFHCLLKGIPADDLKAAIIDGRSIALCFPEHRIICSAVVAGIMPIALGLAWASMRSGSEDRVFCFIGDMTASTGLADECVRYAVGHGLPVRWIIEDNGKSVYTDTAAVWGSQETSGDDLDHYDYNLGIWPHVGTGTFVKFGGL
jgi:pyruvate dehydrogenase E1 component alpha subunit